VNTQVTLPRALRSDEMCSRSDQTFRHRLRLSRIDILLLDSLDSSNRCSICSFGAPRTGYILASPPSGSNQLLRCKRTLPQPSSVHRVLRPFLAWCSVLLRGSSTLCFD